MCSSLVLLLVAYATYKGFTQFIKAKEEAALKQQNPELWYRQQQLELARQQMEQSRRFRQQQSMRQAVGIGATVLRVFLQK